MEQRKTDTACYKVVNDTKGSRYRFFCQLSGAVVCMTQPIRGSTREEELITAWETEGRHYFSKCGKCGKWVCNAMYNPDVLQCVDCAPWEITPRFCKQCGERVPEPETFCRKCGARLLYGEVRLE